MACVCFFVPSHKYDTQQDSSVGKDATLKINSTAPRGVWYVGVFGFLGCSYTLDASSPALACPNGCSQHGTCAAGVCTCAAGWGSLDCSVSNRTLTLGTPVSTSVALQAWSMFYYDVTGAMEKLTFTMDAEKDCDLYLRRDVFPDLFNFDQVNASLPAPGMHDVATLTLENPAQGRWYAGVYGFQGGSFTLRVDSQQITGSTCLNNCSGAAHGACQNGVCRCVPGYSDDRCATKDAALSFGTSEPGYVDAGEWNWFRMELDTANDIRIAVKQNNSGADCDAYVKRGERPDRTHFDQADLSAGDIDMTLGNPGKATYHLGIFGWKACVFTLTMNEVEAASNCGAHGHPNDDKGACVCDAGYFGVDCSVQPAAMNSSQSLQGSVTPGAWKYFMLNASAISYLFTVQETGPRAVGGALRLYVQKTDLPNENNYSSNDKATRTLHYAQDVFEKAEQRVLIAGVFGSPLLPDNTQIPFTIAAFTFH